MDTKKVLYLLGAMDLMLAVMHLAGYFVLFLKPTGYVVPLAVNFAVLAVVAYRSSRFRKGWTIAGMFVILPIMLIHGFWLMLMDYSYTEIDSPWNGQTLVIEYRQFSHGETTYQYNFYKTGYGLIGKRLDGQSINMVIQGTEHPGLNSEGILGADKAEWITENSVRFPAWQGMKTVFLDRDQGNSEEEIIADIEAFIAQANRKENGKSIDVNGNQLITRYDEEADESWIDVISEGDKGPIPRQQCSRIIPNEERGYYMLEECTHRWEYPLFPLENQGGSR